MRLHKNELINTEFEHYTLDDLAELLKNIYNFYLYFHALIVYNKSMKVR